MAEATIDRVPVGQAQKDSGLSRSSFYKRLQHAGVVPLKVGVSSYLTQEHLQRLADCNRWVDSGNRGEEFLAAIGEAPSAGASGALAPQQAQALAAAMAQTLPILPTAEGDAEAEDDTPEELVQAEVEHLDRLLSFLTKAARLSWCLPSKKVRMLVGAQPKGSRFERYGFAFIPAGKHGQETAWRVER